jgi:phosphoribosylanthranilate isomerase
VNSPVRIRVKICCINSIEEAALAIEHGASAIGLVSSMPSGPGVIDEALIAEIARQVPPPVATFLLTAAQDTDVIVEQQRRTGVNTIQIVDRIVRGKFEDLRRKMPGVGLVQVIHVGGPEAIEDARSVEEFVDAVLLDSGNPKLAVKELGGTGRIHDWHVSQRMREIIRVPVFLAGGLKPENVREAVKTVHPFAVDVCTGVRSDGKLDAVKLERFFEALR